MTRRIITSVIGIPLLIFVVLKAGLLLKATILIIALIGQYEFYNAMKIKNRSICFCGYSAAIVYMMLLDKVYTNGIIFTVSLFTLSVLIYSVFKHETITIYDAAIILFGFFYVPFLLSNIYLVREHSLGAYIVWLIFISAWGSDTGAYFTGVAIGKHKLTPSLSPKKTVEGAVGGVLFATVIGFAYAMIYLRFSGLKEAIILMSVVVVFFSSILSQIGDLAASSIKRQMKKKDYGKLFPGHGGVLDRFDSILFTAPTVYCIILIFDFLRR